MTRVISLADGKAYQGHHLLVCGNCIIAVVGVLNPMQRGTRHRGELLRSQLRIQCFLFGTSFARNLSGSDYYYSWW